MIAPMNSDGREDRHLDDRLEDPGDLAGGPVRRVGDGQFLAVVEDHPVDDVRRRSR
jgi:hypothetical protein